jgi:hypothetical protein
VQRYKSWIIETKIKSQLSVISLIISTFARQKETKQEWLR